MGHEKCSGFEVHCSIISVGYLDLSIKGPLEFT